MKTEIEGEKKSEVIRIVLNTNDTWKAQLLVIIMCSDYALFNS